MISADKSSKTILIVEGNHEGFSQTAEAIGLNAPAGLSKEDIIAYFQCLNKEGDEAALKARYGLSQTILSRPVHECKLSNWLASF